MNPLIVEETDNTPKVNLDINSGNLEISGESRPEDVRQFYEPVVQWLEELNNTGIPSTQDVKFNFKFEYFNSSSAKYVMDIIEKLSNIHTNESNNINLSIHWHYDELDEDMLEAGEEFEMMAEEVPFEFHPYE